MQQDADQHRKMMQRKITGHERENVKVSTTAALKM